MRSTRCKVCNLPIPTLNALDAELREGRLSRNAVAKKYRIPKSNVYRHAEAEHHLEPPKLTEEQEAIVAEAKKRATEVTGISQGIAMDFLDYFERILGNLCSECRDSVIQEMQLSPSLLKVRELSNRDEQDAEKITRKKSANITKRVSELSPEKGGYSGSKTGTAATGKPIPANLKVHTYQDPRHPPGWDQRPSFEDIFQDLEAPDQESEQE